MVAHYGNVVSMKLCLRFGMTLLIMMFLAACGSRINQQNYDKITNDMTEAQVESILGKPTETSSGGIGSLSGRSATWKSDTGNISIQFLNGKVLSKQFGSSDKPEAK